FTLSFSVYAEPFDSPCKEFNEAEYCRNVDERVSRSLASNTKTQVMFVFGSKRCGPCNYWKNNIINDGNFPSDIKVIYVPLSFYSPMGRSIEDKGAKELCSKLVKDNNIGTRFLPKYIAKIEPCKRKPTLFLIDLNSNKGEEVNPSAEDGVAPVINHIKLLSKEIQTKEIQSTQGENPIELIKEVDPAD
ncbi:MAG: hypothetical protein M9962_01920, partial [Oligoflexia bacterium]|nr:hypothetical protein [Oligoflexia bacterium]